MIYIQPTQDFVLPNHVLLGDFYELQNIAHDQSVLVWRSFTLQGICAGGESSVAGDMIVRFPYPCYRLKLY